MPEETTLTRGQLAKLTGVGLGAVRFYERKKLIPTPKRSDSGYRLYSNDMVERIQFLKRAQDLGFTLVEIKDLLALVENSRLHCHTVEGIASKKIEEIEKKISDLQNLNKALHDLVGRCSTNDSLKDCPLIESIIDLKK